MKCGAASTIGLSPRGPRRQAPAPRSSFRGAGGSAPSYRELQLPTELLQRVAVVEHAGRAAKQAHGEPAAPARPSWDRSTQSLQVIPHHDTFSTTIQPPYSSTKG
jgi:hypothetical protein